MATNGNTGGGGSRSPRELELALFEKIDTRLDSLVEDVRDVRERVIRIEAQDPSAKISSLETRVRDLENWKSRVAGQVALVVVPIAAGCGVLVKLVLDALTGGG